MNVRVYLYTCTELILRYYIYIYLHTQKHTIFPKLLKSFSHLISADIKIQFEKVLNKVKFHDMNIVNEYFLIYNV